MYSVKITNGSSSNIIHDDRLDARLSDTKIASTINQASSFSFDIYPNNPGWDLLHEYTTGIEVWKLSKLLFKGRVMSVQTNYTNEGQLLKQVSCESQLAYLNDSIQSYKKVQMTPAAFFAYLIGEHNKQVSADRQFKIGRMNVTNSTNNVYCYVEDGLNTFEEIDADLLKNESLGGELWIRNEADGVYIDWLRDGVAKGRQQIKMNKNMLSVYSKPDLNGLCTVLYPFGATPETTATDDKASDVTSPRLTIESVNGGKKYLENADLISIYGRISGSKTWDDVKVAANLKTKGQTYLNTFKAFKIGYEIEAVDLQPLGLAVDDFEVGEYYQVINQLEGLNDYLRIVAITVDLNAPLQSQLTIADKSVKLSEYQLENRNTMAEQRKLAQQAKAQAKRAYDSRLIGTLVDNIVPVGPQDDSESKKETVPLFELQVAENNPDFNLEKGQKFAVKTTARGVDGLDKEIESKMIRYELATTEQPGLMSAADKEKLDGLQQYTEATEEQAGLMPAEDKAKLNKLKEEPVDNVQIKDAVTGSIYLLTISNGEIKLKESDNNNGRK